MVQVLFIRLANPGTHEAHITEFRWYNPESGDINVANLTTMVDWMANKGGIAYICNGERVTKLQVVTASSQVYICANADPNATDNLLRLPKF